jgi:hypothetical protein
MPYTATATYSGILANLYYRSCVHTNRLGPAYTTAHSSSSGGSFNSGSYSNGSGKVAAQPPVTVFSESLCARGLTLSLSSQTAILREALERTGYSSGCIHYTSACATVLSTDLQAYAGLQVGLYNCNYLLLSDSVCSIIAVFYSLESTH